MSNTRTNADPGRPSTNGDTVKPLPAGEPPLEGAPVGQGLTPGWPPAGVQTPPPSNPFDPARYRLSANYGASLGVRKVTTNVGCRKPNRQEFIRTRPGADWVYQTMVFEDKVNREMFLVEPDVAPELAGELAPVCLFLAVNRQNDPFLWPVKLPGPDGRTNEWNDSALQAAARAQQRWVRVAANMTAGHYDVWEATAELPEPQWPDMTLGQLLGVCFRGRIIQHAGHVVIKKLQGEL